MKVKIYVDKETSAIKEIKLVAVHNDEMPEMTLEPYLLGADFRLSLGHGAKLDLGLILKRNEYEIIKTEK